MKLQLVDKKIIDEIKDLHKQAQAFADDSLRASAFAVSAAHKAGQKLKEARKQVKSNVYAAWLEGTFGSEFSSKWAPKYLSLATQLEFNLEDPDLRQLKIGMNKLEIVPNPPHERRPSSEIIRTWETRVIGWTNKFGLLLNDAPQGWRPFLKAQMRELWTWLKTDLFKDELEAR